jgi:hypothetical protein
MTIKTLFLGLLIAGAGLPAASPAAEVQPLLAKIKAVGNEGQGNSQAARAWRRLAACSPDVLPQILAALDDANPTAANWLRSLVEAMVDRTLATGRGLPADKLEAFVLDTRHAGPARRLAYDCLSRVDKTARERLIPGMLHDPAAELRRDAVALVLRQAEALKDRAAAVAVYRKAFEAARDRDQVELIARELKQRGVTVDLIAHFGFLTCWQLLGPLDNHQGVGYARAYPPEKKVDLAEPAVGKNRQRLRWTEHTTSLPYAMMDLNKALGKHMGATAYAFAVVISPKEQPIQLRASSNNAVKIFLNGKQVFGREEYHHGTRMDQHIGAGVLKAGRNEILVKICQNEQGEDWAQTWSFQLRVCDAIGGAVRLEVPPIKSARSAKGGAR